MFNPNFDKIIWYYSVYQNLYRELTDIVTFKEGLPSMEDYDGSLKCLLILDDMMGEDRGLITKIFTKYSHHLNLSVIYITQNLFHKSQREISLNASYILVMKSVRDTQQLGVLARQINPHNSKYIIEAYQDATTNAYGYLLMDMKPTCPDEYRFRTNIFPNETLYVYVPKNKI